MTTPFFLLYLCGDEVNRSLVEGYLADLGGALTDDPAAASACLIDRDHLPFGMTFPEVLDRTLPQPVVVHTYHPERPLRRLCRERGVRLVRRVRRKVLEGLAPRVRAETA
jgi:hypothetical protein